MDTSQETKNSEATSSTVSDAETVEVTPTETIHSRSEDPVPPQATVPFYKKNALFISIAVGIVLILGAGSFVYISSMNGSVVAKVNGVKIYQTDYDKSKVLIEQSATMQGADITDPSVQSEIKTQTLNVLIENMLILSAAEKAGITYTEEEVQTKYDGLVAQLGSQEELEKQMTNLGLTKEKIESNIRERIIADKYIESVTDIESVSVSDEEIDEFLKTIDTKQEGVPPMEELRPQVKEQILSQKKKQMVVNLIKELRAEAKIETLI